MKIIKDIYKLISFLRQCSHHIERVRFSIALIIATGLIGGFSITALITIINSALSRIGSPTRMMVWGFIVFCLLSPVTRFTSKILLIRLTAKSIFTLRMQLCRRILATPLRQLEELGSHRLFATLTEDIPTIIGALTALPHLCVDVAMVVGCLVYMGVLSWHLLLGVLLAMTFGVVTYQLPVSRAQRYFRLAREEADSLFRHYRALADGAKELKLHRPRREAYYSWLEETTNSLQRNNVRGNTIYTAGADWGEVIFFIVIGLILFAVPNYIQLTTGVFTSYIFTIMFMRTPLAQIMNTLPTLGRAAIAVQKVESLGLSLAAQPLEEDSKSESDSKSSWQCLELRGITHTYHREGDDKDFLLGPIELTLHPGELVFLVGGNGSGKTTLAKLLTGLYAPDSGNIQFNGEPITIKNRDDYRQHFSAIFSDCYIFEKFLGFDEASVDAQARDYLVKLKLDHKVKVTNGALSRIDLSQGQRKRLALLTAYLEDRPIYLFDEWAADQDPLFRDVFYHRLLPELKAKGKTIVVISHDERYYHLADRIIKLDFGKLVAKSEQQRNGQFFPQMNTDKHRLSQIDA